MARPRKQLTDADKMRDIENYTHDDKKRTNNPPVGMAQHDKAEEKLKTYQFDPHLDPTLQWAGKAEGMSFEVPTSSIHIHESIKPLNIIARVTKEYSDAEVGQLKGQLGLFEAETAGGADAPPPGVHRILPARRQLDQPDDCRGQPGDHELSAGEGGHGWAGADGVH